MANYKIDNLDSTTNILKALSDRNRARIVMSLRRGRLCVCQIIELLQLAPSTVSKHLYILKQAGLIEADKNGRWIYYRLPKDSDSRAVQNALQWLRKSLARDQKIVQDKNTLDKILKKDPEKLCAKMKKR